jgi:hypothetical protein
VSASRPIDEAMSSDRPDKHRVRTMWADRVVEANSDWAGPEALYLTLAGRYGLDIQNLIDRGVIKMTESQAVDPSDVPKIVAVENAVAAYTDLRQKFPGLRIINDRIEALAGGDVDTTSYPGRKDTIRHALRAHVVNLDYNGPLTVSLDETGLRYPQLVLIEKLAQLHANPKPALDWILFLTLNGEITWSESAHRPIKDFLCENIKRFEFFSQECRTYLGDEVYEALVADSEPDFTALTSDQQRLIVAALVPKRIAALVHHLGWKITTAANWRYGGGGDSAAMCTWAILFRWDSRSSYQPSQVYQESLASIFEGFATVTPTGELEAASSP